MFIFFSCVIKCRNSEEKWVYGSNFYNSCGKKDGGYDYFIGKVVRIDWNNIMMLNICL